MRELGSAPLPAVRGHRQPPPPRCYSCASSGWESVPQSSRVGPGCPWQLASGRAHVRDAPSLARSSICTCEDGEGRWLHRQGTSAGRAWGCSSRLLLVRFFPDILPGQPPAPLTPLVPAPPPQIQKALFAHLWGTIPFFGKTADVLGLQAPPVFEGPAPLLAAAVRQRPTFQKKPNTLEMQSPRETQGVHSPERISTEPGILFLTRQLNASVLLAIINGNRGVCTSPLRRVFLSSSCFPESPLGHDNVM